MITVPRICHWACDTAWRTLARSAFHNSRLPFPLVGSTKRGRRRVPTGAMIARTLLPVVVYDLTATAGRQVRQDGIQAIRQEPHRAIGEKPVSSAWMHAPEV